MNKTLFFVLAFILLACASPSADVQIAEPTATNIPTQTPLPTLEPSPTVELVPSNLNELFSLGGVNITSVENANWIQGDGLEVGGEKITIADLENRLVLGQNNVVQILNPELTEVQYAYDATTNEFLDRADYISWPIVDADSCIQATGWADMENKWKNEHLFMLPFDKDKTYFPNLEDIRWNWSERFPLQSYEKWTPLGLLPQGMDAPTRFVNCVVVDRGAGYPEIVVTMQVFNPADASWSLLHFAGKASGGSIYSDRSIPGAIDQSQPNRYFLPVRNFATSFDRPIENVGGMGGYRNYMQYKGLKINNGGIEVINKLVEEWLTTGKVPPELEEYYLHGNPCLWE